LQREEELKIQGIQMSKICRIQGTEKSKMGSRLRDSSSNKGYAQGREQQQKNKK
jgi:hypothetical protein